MQRVAYDETPHLIIQLTLVYLQDKIKCLLTWKEVKQEQTTYLGILNEAGNNNNNSGKIPICMFSNFKQQQFTHINVVNMMRMT